MLGCFAYVANANTEAAAVRYGIMAGCSEYVANASTEAAAVRYGIMFGCFEYVANASTEAAAVRYGMMVGCHQYIWQLLLPPRKTSVFFLPAKVASVKKCSSLSHKMHESVKIEF